MIRFIVKTIDCDNVPYITICMGEFKTEDDCYYVSFPYPSSKEELVDQLNVSLETLLLSLAKHERAEYVLQAS